MSLFLVPRYHGDLASLRTKSYRNEGSPARGWDLSGTSEDLAVCDALFGRPVVVVADQVTTGCCEGRVNGAVAGFRIESDAIGRWWLTVYKSTRGRGDPEVLKVLEVTHCPWCGGRLFVEKKS